MLAGRWDGCTSVVGPGGPSEDTLRVEGYSFRETDIRLEGAGTESEAGVRLGVMNQRPVWPSFQGSLGNEWQPDHRDAGFVAFCIRRKNYWRILARTCNL